MKSKISYKQNPQAQSTTIQLLERLLKINQTQLYDLLAQIKYHTSKYTEFAVILQFVVGNLQDVTIGYKYVSETVEKIKINDRDFGIWIKSQIQNFQKTVYLWQLQIGMIIYVYHHEVQPKCKIAYDQFYAPVQKYKIPFPVDQAHVNHQILENCFEVASKNLIQWKKLLKQFKQILSNQFYQKDSVINCIKKMNVYNSKLSSLVECAVQIFKLPPDDLFNIPRSSQRWTQLERKYITYRQYDDLKNVKDSFQIVRYQMKLVYGGMNILKKSNAEKDEITFFDFHSLLDLATKSKRIFNMLVSQKVAHEEAQFMISEGNGKLTQTIWNLPDSPLAKKGIQAMLPKVQYSRTYFIPRKFTQYLQNSTNCQFPDLKIKNIAEYRDYLYPRQQYTHRLMLRINSGVNIEEIQDQENIKQPNRFKLFFENIFNKNKAASKVPQQLIYHIHGGGFISMSTFVHQTYIRKWAHELQVPIVSVQYGKAPKHPYPQSLYDCFEGYMWTLHCFKQLFKVNPKKIVITGDSAGANLAACLTNLLIKLGLRKPDGLVLLYGVYNVQYPKFTPSLLPALDQVLLPHTFLKTCVFDYLKKYPNKNPEQDPLISPLATDIQILKQYPDVEMFTGDIDPFHDDNLRFMELINKASEGKAHITIFKEFPHGFIQIHNNGMPNKYCEMATKEIEKSIKKLLGL